MNLQKLKTKAQNLISDLKDNGRFPKENNQIDYKLKLNINTTKSNLDNFLINFTKDIIAFSNADGGIILIGIKEDNITGKHTDVGLDNQNIDLLNQIDLNDVTQKFEKYTKIGVSIDLQIFQISTRKFYYLLIEKNNQVLIPLKDYPELKLTKGAIYYRASSKNEHANKSTSDFNRFLQIKANERSKDFMEIWSKLLPEMFDINPREILMLNPIQNKIYGFNSKENILSSGDIEMDKSNDGVFNIILNAITAGEIGRITDNEGKPLFKIVGEVQDIRERITLTSLEREVKKHSKYKFTNVQLKIVIHHLKWVSAANFQVLNPPEGTIYEEYKEFIWVGNLDSSTDRRKVLFSSKAVPELVEIIDNKDLHETLFGKLLKIKK